MTVALDEAASVLRSARALLVLTGAGISAESGVPTYRGPGGVYETDPSLADVVTAETWGKDPIAVWRYVDSMRGVVARARPNRAHRILADWEARGRFDRFLIATQNVDGLHRAAGSSRVSEIHGNLWEIALPRDVDEDEDEEFARDAADYLGGARGRRDGLLRKWSRENGRRIVTDRAVPFEDLPPSTVPGARPNLVLFDEPYGSRLLWVEDHLRRGCDAVLVVGCSCQVSVVGRLLELAEAHCAACRILDVNLREGLPTGSDVHLEGAATEVLTALDAALG